MGKMLINATQPEEVRVALVEDGRLHTLDIDCPSEVKKKGNIYKARITRIEPSLDAVFVDYGAKRHGFLPVNEIAKDYFLRDPATFEGETPPINQLLREGQELLIQVDKEERGNKGAALTTYITLAGYYAVLMPNSPHSGGISRRIEGEDRDELKEIRAALTLPEDAGLIIRTAGVGKDIKELQSDADMLCNQWISIKQAYETQLAPCLIHQEGDVMIRAIRDNLRKSISEIIIDDHVYYVKAKQFIEQVKPEFLACLKLYNSPIPLFSYYHIESQIETAYQREVLLPSGGALVIDRTEALVAIDVNSAKATGGSDIETTARNTNIEAANEIARQLRLRDLGGLVVIDFIDMSSNKNQRDVENALKEALKNDKARIQVGRISRFGLLEMSRQRLRPSLGEGSLEMCPRCEGRGSVRSVQSHCLSIVRLIEEEALKDKSEEIHVQLPVDMATYLMNEKREYIQHIEKRHHIKVIVIANPYFQAPKYAISKAKPDAASKSKKASYLMIERPEAQLIRADAAAEKTQEPAVKHFSESHGKQSIKKLSWMQRIWRSLFNEEETLNESSSKSASQTHPQKENTGHANRQHRMRRRGGQSSNRSPQHQGQQHQGQNQGSSGNVRRRRPSHHQQGQASRAAHAKTQDGHKKVSSEEKS